MCLSKKILFAWLVYNTDFRRIFRSIACLLLMHVCVLPWRQVLGLSFHGVSNSQRYVLKWIRNYKNQTEKAKHLQGKQMRHQKHSSIHSKLGKLWLIVVCLASLIFLDGQLSTLNINKYHQISSQLYIIMPSRLFIHLKHIYRLPCICLIMAATINIAILESPHLTAAHYFM